MDNGRMMPQAVELEEAVLGALMLEQEAQDIVLDILRDEKPFYKDSHAILYKAMMRLNEASAPIDLLTVTQELKKSGDLEAVGGAYYISQLTNRVASSANVEFHARIVQQKYIQRSLIQRCTKVINAAYQETDCFELTDQLANVVDVVDEMLRGANVMGAMKDLAPKVLERFNERKNASRNNELVGCPTGLSVLDKLTSGWKINQLIIEAARPAMGKTAMMCLHARAGAAAGWLVLIFSLEEDKDALADRIVQGEAGDINPHGFKFGTSSPMEYNMLESGVQNAQKLGIYIDDESGISAQQIRSRVRRFKRAHTKRDQPEPNVLVIVDYLQITEAGSERRYNNREQEISSISRSLKGTAKKCKVAVIALAQLSRAVETRGGDKRPQLSDLRESGAIEQDADIVLFIHRPEYYGLDQDAAGNSTAGVGELILAKQRNGAVSKHGEVQFHYNKSITHITDPEKKFQSDPLQTTLLPNESFLNNNEDLPF